MNEKISTVLGSLLIFSFGFFVLTMGFKLAHMINPLEEAIAMHSNIPSQ